MLEGWYLGQETGHGVADVVFGRVNPGGHLPVTIARNAGQVRDFYNHKPTARRGYLFDSAAPLYPFGFGLSYTTFDISAPRLARSTIGTNESVGVDVDVTNTGRRTGDEVVQLYVRDDAASVTRPVLELKRFQRVTLRPGERRTIHFELDPLALDLLPAGDLLPDVPAAGLDHAFPRAGLDERRVRGGGRVVADREAAEEYQDETPHSPTHRPAGLRS